MTQVRSVGKGLGIEGLVGFDTSIAGTPEACWETLQLHPWFPAEGELIVVAPHPDDETFGAGGLIHTWVRRQLPVTIISLTNGEAACAEVANLASVRQAELENALRALSADTARVLRLGIPDGRVRYYSERLIETLKSVTSAGATLVAPFERDGHTDHDAAGVVARRFAQRNRISFAAYPIWAWHQATPLVFSDRRIVRFSLSLSAREAKDRAIECFVSQLQDRPGGPIVPAHVLRYFKRDYEMFVL